jgi:hypothetical protein
MASCNQSSSLRGTRRNVSRATLSFMLKEADVNESLPFTRRTSCNLGPKHDVINGLTFVYSIQENV